MDKIHLIVWLSITLIITGSILIFMGLISRGGTEVSGGFVVLIGPIPIVGSFGKQGIPLLVLLLVIALMLMAISVYIYPFLKKKGASWERQ